MDRELLKRMKLALGVSEQFSFDQDNKCLDDSHKGRSFEALYYEQLRPDFRFGELGWDRKCWAGYVPTMAELALFQPRKHHIWVVNHDAKEILFEGWMPEDKVAAIEDVYRLWIDTVK